MVSETACSLLTNKSSAGLRVHHHVNETLKPAKGKWQCPLISFLFFVNKLKKRNGIEGILKLKLSITGCD